MSTLRACTDCENPTSRVGPRGEPLCSVCREIRIDQAIESPGGSNIKVVAMQKDCDACGYRRSIPVTTVLGSPPEWERLCEACLSIADAVCFERQAARLRERAALILRGRRRQGKRVSPRVT